MNRFLSSRPATPCTVALIVLAVLFTHSQVEAQSTQPPPVPKPSAEQDGASGKPAKPDPFKATAEAAAERWKMSRVWERLNQVGLMGQQDLFWELVHLWEKDEKSRSDKDLIAIMDRLLFRANLWSNTTLATPINEKVVAFVPSLGDRILDKRLQTWLNSAREHSTGAEPWRWARFHELPRERLAAAVNRLIETGPKHNPVARLWMTAALLSVDKDKGTAAFTEARTKLKKDLPTKADSISLSIIVSLAEGGIKDALPMLLDLAESGTKPTSPMPRSRFSPSYTPSHSALPTFYRLTGVRWTYASGRQDQTNALAQARKWLEANFKTISWDAKKRRYVGAVAYPGMEAIQAPAVAVKKKFGFECLERLAEGKLTYGKALLELASLMETKPEAVKDKDMRALVSGCIDSIKNAYENELPMILGKMPRIDPELGARLWSRRVILGAPRQGLSGFSTLFKGLPDLPPEKAAIFRKHVSDELQKEETKQLKAGANTKALAMHVAGLFLGNPPNQAKLAQLTAKAPSERAATDQSRQLEYCATEVIQSGNVNGLKLLLMLGRKDLKSYKTRGYSHPITRFGQYLGWPRTSDYSKQNPEELLKKCESWLARHESKLKWDRNKRQFKGAPPPRGEALAEVTEYIEKTYKLKIQGDPTRERDDARRLFSELVLLMAAKPEAAKDPKVGEAIIELIPLGSLDQDRLLRTRLYSKVPKMNRDLGVRILASFLKKELFALVGRRSSPGTLTNLETRIPDLDKSMVPEARKLMAPEVKKKMDAAGDAKVNERISLHLIGMYSGLKLPFADLDKHLEEAGKVGDTSRFYLATWGEAIARAGNPDGLRLILMEADRNQNMRRTALNTFEYMVGVRSKKYDYRAHRKMTTAQRKALVASHLKWLEKNQATLQWNPATGRYKGFTPTPAPTPPQPPRVPTKVKKPDERKPVPPPKEDF